MNDLEKYFSGNNGRLIDKWKHYFEIYDRHFSRFRGTDVHLVEFGVYQGGSLQMWKDFYDWYAPRECDFRMSSLAEKAELFRKMRLALPVRKIRQYLRRRKVAQSGAGSK